METKKVIEKVVHQPVDWLKEFKDVYLAKKQGEAIERSSTPLTHNEALSLGKYQHQAAYALSVIDLHQQLIRQLTGYGGNALTNFTETVSRASGSIGATRMEKTLEAVATIGQYYPDGKRMRQAPEAVDLNG